VGDRFEDHKKKIAERQEAAAEGVSMEAAVPELEDPQEQEAIDRVRLTDKEISDRRYAFTLGAAKHGAGARGYLNPETVGKPALREGRGLATFCIICHAPLGSCNHFVTKEE